MDTQIFHTQLIVEDVLKKWPQTFSVFRNRGTDCVGCMLQRFCTLQDVAATYDLELNELVKDLETCVKRNYQSQRSAQ